MEDPREIEELIAEFVARRESGEHLTPATFAAERGEHGGTLREALEALAGAEAMFPEGAGELPERIGPYRVIEQLGQGGMGRVFRVEDEREPGSTYALKWMHPIALLNPRSRERFAREAEVLSKLDVPGIVHVREFVASGENPYVVMELIEGDSLAEELDRARLRAPDADPVDLPGEGAFPQRAGAWVARLARVVEQLHARGVLHRDLKPGNVLVRSDGAPVVVDFGLASVENAATLTATGDLLGTPHYMAPEQALGRGADARTDVYALGAILYELLTRRPPHSGTDHAAVLESIKSEPILPVRRLHPEIPRALSAILARALAFRREDRFQSADALATDLESFAAGRPVRARASWTGRLHDLHRFHPRALLAAAAGVAAIVIGVAWYQTRPVEDPEILLQQALDRATLAYAAGNMEQARAEAEAILELDPANPTGEFLVLGGQQSDSDDPVVEALVYGNQYRRAGKLRQAESAFRRAMQLAPDSPLPVILLGQVSTEIGEQSDRVPELLESIERQPHSSALYQSLGYAYLVQGRCAEAVEAYAQARAYAGEPRAGILLPEARAHHCAGDTEQGLASLREGIANSGEGADLAPTLEWFVKEQGQGEGVRAILRELLAEDPNNTELTFWLATSYDWEELIYEAAQHYSQVLEREPDHTRALLCLMHLHSGANRDTCEKCAAAFEEHPELYDPDRAEEYCLRMVDLVGRGSLRMVLSIVNVGARIGRLDKLEAKLEEVRREARSEKEVERMTKALNKVRGLRASSEDR